MLNNFSNLNLSVSPDFMWGLLALGLFLFLGISFILNYHWRYYGVKDNPKVFAKTIYWMVAFILIGIMTIALLSYEASLMRIS
jgi:hypothetical protein